MTTNAELFEQDFFAWAQTTAALIRAGKWQAIDPQSVAEEIESLGKRDRRELGSRLQVLVMYLLKWHYLSSERSGSWRDTMEDQRAAILDLLNDSPSLRRQAPAILAQRYPRVRAKVCGETGLPVDTSTPNMAKADSVGQRAGADLQCLRHAWHETHVCGRLGAETFSATPRCRG
jgi:hypothetical protein